MKKLIVFVSVVFVAMGCESYLDKIEDSDGFLADEVFSEYQNHRQYVNGMYPYLHDYLSSLDYSWIAALSDEGFMNSEWETMGVAQSGDWLRAFSTGQALQFYRIWSGWDAIRRANLSLQNLSMLEGNATEEQINELKGQDHFMRAWFHYEFLRRQGGMPYIEEVFESSDDFARERLSYHETALKIAADCDTAMQLLPVRWNSANLGRPTAGAAMALKATALLFSASPTNNPANDQSRWALAAEASWDLIEMAQSTNRYYLLPSNGTDEVSYNVPGVGNQTITYPSGFDSIFMYQQLHDEIIWENYPASSSANATYTVLTVPSIASGGVIQGFSPSSNIVDLFETTNGLSIADDPAFNAQNPYVDRDPRFYHSILFNNEIWTSTNRPLELWEGGEDRDPTNQFSNHTGFLARKFWAKNVDSQSGNPAPMTHKIYFRYADILLQYAEAANELGGPNHAIAGASMTALEAINLVRARVNMPPVNVLYTGTQESFRERLKNERAVELFLEGKRLFDLSRWGDAHKMEHKALYGLSFTEDAGQPTGYLIQRQTDPVIILTFDQKHYKWPIPLDDALIFDEFKQNPGW